jgi:hypothetical protein
LRAPLKSCDFDGQAVISTAQIPDDIGEYLRKVENNRMIGAQKRVFGDVQL